jgi:hypothetical protein
VDEALPPSGKKARLDLPISEPSDFLEIVAVVSEQLNLSFPVRPFTYY